MSASTVGTPSQSVVAQQAGALALLAGAAPSQLSTADQAIAQAACVTLSKYLKPGDTSTAKSLLNTMTALTGDASVASVALGLSRRRLFDTHVAGLRGDSSASRIMLLSASAQHAESLQTQLNTAIHSMVTGIMSGAYPGQFPTVLPVSACLYECL